MIELAIVVAIMAVVFVAAFVLIRRALCAEDWSEPVDLTTWSDEDLSRELFACEYWIGEGDWYAEIRKRDVEAEIRRRGTN